MLCVGITRIESNRNRHFGLKIESKSIENRNLEIVTSLEMLCGALVLPNISGASDKHHASKNSIVFTHDSIYAIALIYYRPSVCLSVRHTCIIEKRLKLGL